MLAGYARSLLASVSSLLSVAMGALRTVGALQSLLLLRFGRVAGAAGAATRSYLSTAGGGTSRQADDGHPDAGSVAANLDCACYFTENFYVRSPIRGHYTYEGADAFRDRYASLLSSLAPAMQDELLANLEREAERRRAQAPAAAARKARIAREYVRLHPELWELREEWLHPDFVALVEGAKAASERPLTRGGGGGGGAWKGPTQIVEGVYTLAVFSPAFCELLCEELDHFRASGLPCGQPNSMNRYGALLDELGFSSTLINPLIHDYLRPLCGRLAPLAAAGGATLDRHKAFVVAYRLGEDEALSTHFDNAEVTLNINLGRDFEAGELLFFGHRRSAGDKPIGYHEWGDAGVGHGVLHLGEHVHAALPITAGDRRNLVVWMRSTERRRRAGCPMCGETGRLLLPGVER